MASASAGITGSCFVTDGHVSASTFHGDGSALTGIAAGGGGAGLWTAVNATNAYITSSVRVGTSGTPGYPLEVSGTINVTSSFPISGGSVLLRGNGTALVGINDTNTDIRLGSSDSGKTISFHCGNPPDDPAMRLTDAGRLGVGTTSASHEIHVVADDSPTIRVEDNRNLVQTDLYASATMGGLGTNSNHEFSLFTNNTTALLLDTNQNVTASAGNFLVPNDKIGIGLNDGVEPSGSLHIQDGAGAGVTPFSSYDNFVLESDQSVFGMSILGTDSGFPTLAFGCTSDSMAASLSYAAGANLFTLGTGRAGAEVKIGTGPVNAEALRLDANQNVTASAGNFLVPSGKIGIGLPDGVEPLGSTGDIHLEQPGGASCIFFEREDSSITDGQELGCIAFGGTQNGGASYAVNSSVIRSLAEGNWGAVGVDHGSKLDFMTTKDGTGVVTSKMTISGEGNVGIGTSAPGESPGDHRWRRQRAAFTSGKQRRIW